MGDLFQSSKGQQSSQGQQTAPWAAQQPYLTQAFSTAGNTLNRQQSTPFYSGELYANLNPTQLGALGNLNSYAAGGGSNVGNQFTNAGSSLLPGVVNAGNNASTIFNKTQQDPTQSIINSAGQYANNPYTQGMITAAQRPIEQQLNETALPGLDQQATGTGNTDSSRAGVAEAILRRNAGNQEGDIAANILGNQYNAGINTASGLYGTNLQGSLAANSGVLNAGTTGANLLDQGYNTTLNNLNIPLQTGTVQQQNQQGADTSAYGAWQAQQQYPWTSLQNFMGIVGNPSYGSSSSGSSNTRAESNPSMFQNFSDVYNLLSDPRFKVVEPDLMDGFGDDAKTSHASKPSNQAPSGAQLRDWLMSMIGSKGAGAGAGSTPGGGGGGLGSVGGMSANSMAGGSGANAAAGGLATSEDAGVGMMGTGGYAAGGAAAGGSAAGGSGFLSGILSMFSDPRMKVVGGNTHGALDAVDQIGIKRARYLWDQPGTERPMMMAPQVQKVLPSAVTGVPNGPQPQTIKINDMLPVLVGAIKELHQKVKNK